MELRVFNVAGRTIRHLVSQSMVPGAYSLTWDGLDDQGEQAATGLYLIAVIEPKRVEIKKVVVVKQ